jgi:hypothetical protein
MAVPITHTVLAGARGLDDSWLSSIPPIANSIAWKESDRITFLRIY